MSLSPAPSQAADNTVASHEARFQLLVRVLHEVGVTSSAHRASELCYRRIDRDTLLDPALVTKLVGYQDELKKAYSTAKLSCLHKNNIDKQKTPGVCLVRQLLKANGIRMLPQTESMGYDLGSGRKLVRRWYLLQPAPGSATTKAEANANPDA